MVESADEARKRAAIAAAAQKLVNDAAALLAAAADRGETAVPMAVGPIDIPLAKRLAGRLHDAVLIEALDNAGEASLARACRTLAALGFALSAAPIVEREEDVDRVADIVRRIRITCIELGFAAAQEGGRGAAAQMLPAVALPPAHLWRARAESARLLRQYERKALAVIGEHAERGGDNCRIAWRELSAAPVNAELFRRLADALQGRGFRVETVDAGTTLRLIW